MLLYLLEYHKPNYFKNELILTSNSKRSQRFIDKAIKCPLQIASKRNKVYL